MSDPLSVTASVIGVATLAYQSCKALNDIISSFVDAPKTLRDMCRDLDALQSLLASLQVAVDGVPDASLSADQRACLAELKPPVQSCHISCDDFIGKLAKVTSHSEEGGRVNWLDRARLHFNEKDITSLKSRLGDCKQTLNVALGVVTLKTARKSQASLEALETQIASTVSTFMGKIEGIELALQSLTLSDTGTGSVRSEKPVGAVSEQGKSVVDILNEHSFLLKQCLKACASGLAETTNTTGTRVRYACTFDEARQHIGNIGDIQSGGPAVEVDTAEARNKSRQVVGNITADFAKDFLA